jgi:hypothetical protein
MSTLSTLLSSLRDYMKSDPKDKIWGADVKTSALNSAYFQIQKDGNFNWPQNQDTTTGSTTSGTQEYSLPSDFIRMDLVQFTDISGELQGYTKELTLRNGNTGTGRPSNYYIWSQKLGFYPTPDSGYTYRLMYRKRLPTMTSAVDSAFPADFDDAIVRYAAYILWSTTKVQGKTTQALQDYKLFLDQLKNAYLYQDVKSLSFPYQRGINRQYKYDPKVLTDS